MADGSSHLAPQRARRWRQAASRPTCRTAQLIVAAAAAVLLLLSTPLAAAADVGGAYIVLLQDRLPAATAQASAFRAASPRRTARSAAAAAAAPASGLPWADGSVQPEEARAAAAAAVEAYEATLRAAQTDVLASVVDGGAVAIAAAAAARQQAGAQGQQQQLQQQQAPWLVHHYTAAVNGFAAAGLTTAQAAALRLHPSVQSVVPVRRVEATTYTTPAFLGLSGTGLWQSGWGGAAGAGQNVLIGVLDSGITPAAPSFASPAANASTPWTDLGPGSAACGQAGSCVAGKILGCRYFEATYAVQLPLEYPPEYRLASDISTCLDHAGHGTHVSATAGGNSGVPAASDGAPLGSMSGVAPGAAVATYKALWVSVKTGGLSPGARVTTGYSADLVAGVDAAVKDGVDVINYSGGSKPSAYWWEDPLFEAFRGAAAAGVLVTAAGGNQGGASDVDNNMPWAVTVAAGTHSRAYLGDVTLALPNGTSFTASGMHGGAADGAVASTAAYFAGGRGRAARCARGALSRRRVQGKVVLCLYKGGPPQAPSQAAQEEGAAGVVLISMDPTIVPVEEQLHPLPVVHVGYRAGQRIIAAVADSKGAAAVAISPRYLASGGEAPFVAYFSSRGPSITDNAATLKPDLLAPGSEVFAPTDSEYSGATTGAALSGTSMAAPHVAGVAALIMSKHPTWSAAAVRSALLTSALNVTNRGNPLDGTPFHYGAGLLNPKGALDPGLVYDAGDADAQRYLCSMVLNKEAFDPAKTKPPAAPPYCASACADAAKCAYPQALRDYNQASFSLPGFKLRGAARKQSARRAVSFVGTGGATFTAQLTLPAGYKGAVAADGVQQKGAALGGSQLSFSAPGEAKAFTLSVTATRRAPKGWSFGSLTWVDANGRWVVRSTIALQRA